MNIPKLMDLEDCHAATGGKIPKSRIRRAVREGDLRAYRSSTSCSAKILIAAEDLAVWVRSLAGRNVVPSPSEVHAALVAGEGGGEG